MDTPAATASTVLELRLQDRTPDSKVQAVKGLYRPAGGSECTAQRTASSCSSAPGCPL